MIRRRVAEHSRTGSTEPFELLKAIGRDCVGAVQILDEDEVPTGFDQIEGEPLSEEAIERHLIETVSPQASLRAETRMPISASRWPVRRRGGLPVVGWAMARAAWRHADEPHLQAPARPDGRAAGGFSTSVDNEWLCLRLLKAYGLPVADARIATFGGQRVLVVERFDRRIAPNGQWLMRLPGKTFARSRAVRHSANMRTTATQGSRRCLARCGNR